MFSVSLAFTGPILPLVTGPKAGGFQIWGAPETGKTTAAMVAGSVWGCHRGEGHRERGFAESWNSTSGKVEVTALAHNDALLILDETKRAGKDDRDRAQVVTLVGFGLAEMTEKERLTNQGSARWWRCYFLSTSNFSLGELARRGGVVIDEANRGRMADIPLPNTVHGVSGACTASGQSRLRVSPRAAVTSPNKGPFGDELMACRLVICLPLISDRSTGHNTGVLMVDIARPSQARKKQIRRAIYGAAAIAAIALISVGIPY